MTHNLLMKTGVKKGAGVDANIYAKLGDATGKWSKETLLDNWFRDDFESGSTDSFYLDLPEMKGRITELQIRRDSSGADDDWYLERATVQGTTTGEKTLFPVNRWIHANDLLTLSEHDCSLPFQDKYLEQRKAELERKRNEYPAVWDVPGLPMSVCTPPPRDEDFGNDYESFLSFTKLRVGLIGKFVQWCASEFENLKDFERIYYFSKTPLPEGAVNWKSDESFGNQRLTSINPTMIQLCTGIPKGFAVTDKMVKQFLEGKTLSQAIAAKKIYIEDLTFLKGLPVTEGKQLCSPYALFYVKNSGDLIPIAIQLEPEPAADNPVFLPTDPEYTWLMAKMWMNLADSSVHQSASHLGLTHLAMESIALCAHRQISPSHPIFHLLAPHFLYLMNMNRVGIVRLIGPNGWVDQVMQIGRPGMLEIIKRKWATWNLKEDGHLLNNLKKRGVDDVKALPNYHYRDDAILMWNAISDYVDFAVNQIYDTQEKLLKDYEIQNFAAEVSSQDGAAIKGVPPQFTTTDDLKELITVMIFTCSAQHAAVNFGQYDEYAFQPNYPASIKTAKPTSKAPLTEEDVVAALPTKEDAIKVIQMTTVLSSKATNSLGYFEVNYGLDPESQEAVKRFRESLRKVGETIDARNESRANPYTYLHPDAVPNAISI